MDALDVAKVCLRRWFVVIPILVLAFGAGLSMRSHRESSYTGTAAFALIYTQVDQIKPNQPDPRLLNPLANGGGSVLQDSVIADLTSPTTERQLAAGGLTPVGAASTANGPTLTTGTAYAMAPQQGSSSIIVSASGPSAPAVISTLNNVLAEAPKTAAAIQTRLGAPKASQLTAVTTASPQVIVVPPPSGLKLLIAIMAVGCLAAAGVALVVDRLLTRRRSRIQKRAETQELMSGLMNDLQHDYQKPLVFAAPYSDAAEFDPPAIDLLAQFTILPAEQPVELDEVTEPLQQQDAMTVPDALPQQQVPSFADVGDGSPAFDDHAAQGDEVREEPDRVTESVSATPYS